jgi:proline iminopeptidase
MLRPSELAWYYQAGASHLFPDKWESYLAPIPEEERGDLMGAYRRRLTSPDPNVQFAAPRAWAVREGETGTLLPNPAVADGFRDTGSQHRSPSLMVAGPIFKSQKFEPAAVRGGR